MSLRDYFAGQALAAGIDPRDGEDAAEAAYHLADAMISARRMPSQEQAAAVEMLRVLEGIVARIDELETGNHSPVAFEELRGLQEMANKAIKIASAAGVDR